MVRPGKVVSKGLRGVIAQEHGPGIVQLAQILKGVIAADLQVLGSQLVGELHRLIHILANYHRAVAIQ